MLLHRYEISVLCQICVVRFLNVWGGRQGLVPTGIYMVPCAWAIGFLHLFSVAPSSSFCLFTCWGELTE